MGIANWSVPFNLTSKDYSNFPIPGTLAPDPLPINAPFTMVGGDLGVYRLKPTGCSLNNTVRSTKDYIPQGDGAILHRRVYGGLEMPVTFQLWQPNDKIACDDILQEMVDILMGYLTALINAGDNEGRISWTPDGQAARMLDDIRLLSDPVESQEPGAPYEIACTFDCELPYAENLQQLSPAVPGNVVNLGNRPTFPVWKLDGPISQFTLTDATTGIEFTYDSGLPGAISVPGGSYLEINTFKDTVYLNGAGRNLKPGVVMEVSEFEPLQPGTSAISITNGVTGVGLINAAWR